MLFAIATWLDKPRNCELSVAKENNSLFSFDLPTQTGGEKKMPARLFGESAGEAKSSFVPPFLVLLPLSQLKLGGEVQDK